MAHVYVPKLDSCTLVGSRLLEYVLPLRVTLEFFTPRKGAEWLSNIHSKVTCGSRGMSGNNNMSTEQFKLSPFSNGMVIGADCEIVTSPMSTT